LESDARLLADGGLQLSGRQHSALLYRAGQKALAREYLAYTTGLLQAEMSRLSAAKNG
jgi:hypothetical protein